MAVQGPVRRVLVYGAVVGALVFATPASAAKVTPPSASTVAAAALRHGERGGTAKYSFPKAHGSQFCRWFPDHGFCVQRVNQRRVCDGRPDHGLCAQADEVSFCQGRPDHPLCDDDRFCRNRPDHPLCNDEPPPSPS